MTTVVPRSLQNRQEVSFSQVEGGTRRRTVRRAKKNKPNYSLVFLAMASRTRTKWWWWSRDMRDHSLARLVGTNVLPPCLCLKHPYVKGDSGGPLVGRVSAMRLGNTSKEDRAVLVGVLSGGAGPCSARETLYVGQRLKRWKCVSSDSKLPPWLAGNVRCQGSYVVHQGQLQRNAWVDFNHCQSNATPMMSNDYEKSFPCIQTEPFH